MSCMDFQDQSFDAGDGEGPSVCSCGSLVTEAALEGIGESQLDVAVGAGDQLEGDGDIVAVGAAVSEHFEDVVLSQLLTLSGLVHEKILRSFRAGENTLSISPTGSASLLWFDFGPMFSGELDCNRCRLSLQHAGLSQNGCGHQRRVQQPVPNCPGLRPGQFGTARAVWDMFLVHSH
jgi:hypothetical protein